MDDLEGAAKLLHAEVSDFDSVAASPDKALVSVRGRVISVCI